MFEEAISVLSIWASMNSWLTPTVLFLLLNLMIGTIAVTSGFTTHKPHHPNHPKATAHHHHHHQLTPAPSLLHRLKSINFYNYYTHTHTQPTQVPEPVPDPVPEPIPEPQPRTRPEEEDDGPSLDEVYSRIIQKGNPNHNYGRQNSDTKPAGGEIPVRLPRKIKKSATDKSAFNHFEAAVEKKGNAAAPPPRSGGGTGDEEVDAKADDFINRFRQQLKLQRLESLYGAKK